LTFHHGDIASSATSIFPHYSWLFSAVSSLLDHHRQEPIPILIYSTFATQFNICPKQSKAFSCPAASFRNSRKESCMDSQACCCQQSWHQAAAGKKFPTPTRATTPSPMASKASPIIRSTTLSSEAAKEKCIGRESNPGLAEFGFLNFHTLATANFTTKPPMLYPNWMIEDVFLLLHQLY
jgi:hypothetical protein